MHRLLLYKGYMFPEIRHEDAAVLNPSDVCLILQRIFFVWCFYANMLKESPVCRGDGRGGERGTISEAAGADPTRNADGPSRGKPSDEGDGGI